VRYRSVYPGVDLVYYGDGDRLEFDFEVAPGADPGRIRVRVSGAEALLRGSDGDLRASVAGAEERLLAPVVYQVAGGRRRPVAGGFALFPRDGNGPPSVGFRLGSYDRSAPLVIDPVLLFSTYLGGSDYDEVDGLAVDLDGNTYVGGRVYSTDFPVTSGGAQAQFGGNEDTYVTKIDPSGTAIVYSTFIGGSDRDFGNGIAVNAPGEVYLAGRTISPDFPGAAASPIQKHRSGPDDGFVLKLDASGSEILFSTYLGGTATDRILGIALDPSSDVYVTGVTDSPGFPGTAHSTISSSYRGGETDAFAARIAADGSRIVWATYLGGSDLDGGSSIALDRAGRVGVGGFTYSSNFIGAAASGIQPHRNGESDGFVAMIDPTGTALLYSTYLGGSGNENVNGVVFDARGEAFVAGFTDSTDFVTTPGALQRTYAGGDGDAFVTRIARDGSAILSSTYVGGSGYDYADAIALDSVGGVYLAGFTESLNFPGAAASAIQSHAGGQGDGFAMELAGGGKSIVYATYLGGSDYDEAYAIATSSRSLSVGGVTGSEGFPGTDAASLQQQYGGNLDGFVARISAADVPARSIVPIDPPTPAIIVDR
jgi:hypothetical protein